MKTIQEIRQQYPQYSDLSDDQLAQALHRKHYSDMDYADFSARIGLAKPQGRTFGQEVGRQLGLTARNALEGVGGTIGVLTDPFVYSAGAATGQNFAGMQDTATQLADALGLPSPQGVERIGAAGQQALLGGAGVVGLARSAATRVPGLAGEVARRVGMFPGAQMVAATGGGVGGETARQAAEAGGLTERGQIAAQIGGTLAGGLAPAAIQAGGRSLRRVANLTESRVADELRQAEPNVDALLEIGARSRVPGVQRTVVEETLSPELVNLERRVTAQGSTANVQAQQRNTLARVQALRNIAGTEDDLVKAIADRRTISEPLRRQAVQRNSVDMTRALSQLTAAERAVRGDPDLQSMIGQIKTLVNQAQGSIGADVSELYRIRNYIGKMISGQTGPTPDAARAAARELLIVRDSLDNVIKRQVPEYRQYLDKFRELSGDVNRLQFGQELLRRSTKGEGEFAQIMPDSFLQNTRDIGSRAPSAGANRLAAQATGFRKAQAGNILPPEDIEAIRAIRQDFMRMQEVNRVRSGTAGGNSQTALAQNLTDDAKEAIDDIFDRIPVLSGINKRARARAAMALGDALANPNQARAILARFPAGERAGVRDAMLAVGITLDTENE